MWLYLGLFYTIYNPYEQHYVLLFCISYIGWPQKLAQSNINRFSKLFHCQNQEKISNNNVTKDPITPQLCRSTIL